MSTNWQWLNELTFEDIMFNPVPFEKLLNNSVYYPASGDDGSVIYDLMNNSRSFVYVDYGYNEETINKLMQHKVFQDYHIIARRQIDIDEITYKQSMQGIDVSGKRIDIGSWYDLLWLYKTQPHEFPDKNDKTNFDETDLKRWIKPFNAFWTIWESKNAHEEKPGQKRFSLITICADGVASFDSLYYTWKAKPLVMCFKQSDGFSSNWTYFCQPKLIMHRLAMNNPAGIPNSVLVYIYKDGCLWPEYPVFVNEYANSRLFTIDKET